MSSRYRWCGGREAVVSPGKRTWERETLTAIKMFVDGESGQEKEAFGQSQPHSNQILAEGFRPHGLSLSLAECPPKSDGVGPGTVIK